MCARDLSQELQRRFADPVPAAEAPEAELDFAVVERVYDVSPQRDRRRVDRETLKRV